MYFPDLKRRLTSPAATLKAHPIAAGVVVSAIASAILKSMACKKG